MHLTQDVDPFCAVTKTYPWLQASQVELVEQVLQLAGQFWQDPPVSINEVLHDVHVPRLAAWHEKH
jgi:hypothetical protein